MLNKKCIGKRKDSTSKQQITLQKAFSRLKQEEKLKKDEKKSSVAATKEHIESNIDIIEDRFVHCIDDCSKVTKEYDVVNKANVKDVRTPDSNGKEDIFDQEIDSDEQTGNDESHSPQSRFELFELETESENECEVAAFEFVHPFSYLCDGHLFPLTPPLPGSHLNLQPGQTDSQINDNMSGIFSKTSVPVSYRAFDSFVCLPHQSESINEKLKWNTIVRGLKDAPKSPYVLEKFIMSYNDRKSWNVSGIRKYFNGQYGSEDKDFFFEYTLPKMCNLALQVEYLFPYKIPHLIVGGDAGLTMTQQQITCLLCLGFFCVFRESRSRGFPGINFNRIFHCTTDIMPKQQAHKLKCLIHYFIRVTQSAPIGLVTFERFSIRSPISWEDCEDPLSRLVCSSQGTIEDSGIGLLQVDFANRMIGGGVLGKGLVQEEIRFLISPELIASLLFTEEMRNEECVIISGTERFSTYTGYSNTFEWTGNYQDQTQRDSDGRMLSQVCAIDALVFDNYEDQFDERALRRECLKSYCGFKNHENVDSPCAIATGNWGCGAFKGNLELKSLIQLIAASLAKRDICYFTFGDEPFSQSLKDVHNEMLVRKWTIGKLWSHVVGYGKSLETDGSNFVNATQRTGLFDSILSTLT